MRRMRRVRHGRRGFTLLEILIVVGIIALLAAFVVPSFMKTQDQVNIDLTRALIKSGGNVAGQLEIYRTAVGKYPEELKYLSQPPEDEEQAKKWRGPYITDPGSLKDAWGHDLQYKMPGEYNKETYDLWSWGPDGQDGTEDDIQNWTSG